MVYDLIRVARLVGWLRGGERKISEPRSAITGRSVNVNEARISMDSQEFAV